MTRVSLMLITRLMLLGCCLLLSPSAAVAQQAAPEYQIKAAFLLKFPAYVVWPASAFTEGPFVIGVQQSDDMVTALAALGTGLVLEGRVVEVRTLAEDSALDGLHVLFMGPEGEAAESRLAEAVARSILTITEARETVPRDSMINFAVVDDRVRFDVALAPARQAGLQLSALLLQVARQVTGVP